MTKLDIASALESAIEAFTEEIPGYWRVDTSQDCVYLIWECDVDHTPEMYGDEPWSMWGGEEILKLAGIREFDNSGIDCCVDKFGHESVMHWVLLNTESED